MKKISGTDLQNEAISMTMEKVGRSYGANTLGTAGSLERKYERQDSGSNIIVVVSKTKSMRPNQIMHTRQRSMSREASNDDLSLIMEPKN